MDRSFGEDYITQVMQRQSEQSQVQNETDDSKTEAVTIAGDVALNQLRIVLITMNGISLLVIPAISWLLAKKTIAPIQIAHEKQKQFVSDASHELRTPLSIMTGEIDIALGKDRSVSEYKNILHSSKEELKRLTSLVENLLFLARDGQTNRVSFTETVDMTDLLLSLIAQLKPIATKKHLEIYFDPPEENVVLKGNGSLLHQLFFNLIDNAIKYTNKGKVQITLKQVGKIAQIYIQDSGIGISEENKVRLFDRFYRVDTARSQIKGYGLGLAISQAIVNKHCGSIRIDSTLGNGSTFIVSIPVNKT
jgi:signal transduction histidine kinase